MSEHAEEENPSVKKRRSREAAVTGELRPLDADFADFSSERAVLAAVMSEPECLDTVVTILGGFQLQSDEKKTLKGDPLAKSVFQRVASIMFRDPKHAAIYEAMLELRAKGDGKGSASGIDLLTLSRNLQAAGKLDVIGGQTALMQIQDSISSTANLETWCTILRDYAMLREMIRTCSHALDLCRNPKESVKSLLDTIEAEIYKVRNQFVQPEIRELKDLVVTVFDDLLRTARKEQSPGIATGFPELDRLVAGGLKPGEMFVLAARPSIGKTAIALNIVRNIIMKGGGGEHAVAFFSLEMTGEQVTQRMLCTEAKIPLSSFLDGSFRGDDLPHLTQAAATLSKGRLFIDPTGGITLFELRSKARKLKEAHKIDLIVIDYLQLMKSGESTGSDGRQVEVAMISGGLKKLAKDLGVPVLVLAQLNREVEKGQGGKNALPKLSNLRESGAIEQDADVVVFLHRNRDDAKESNADALRSGLEAKLIVEKNRNGKTGFVDLLFFPSLMEFRSVEHKYAKTDIPEA